MSLTVQTEQRGDMVVVSVAGELDMATAPSCRIRSVICSRRGGPG